MPTSSRRPCPECRVVLITAKQRLCPTCRKKSDARFAIARHGTDADDTYYHTAEWRHLRDDHMRREPLCRRCGVHGRVVAGYGVNHIIARRLGGSDCHDNLETLCKGHLTSADQRGVVKRQCSWLGPSAGGPGGSQKSSELAALKRRSAETHTHEKLG
jgi:5-methylcytosine-specific restriction endonuclease McrA